MDYTSFDVFCFSAGDEPLLKYIMECKSVLCHRFILVNCTNLCFIVPRPLGMESGAIKDSQITASGETTGGTRDQSHLNAGPEKAWCVNETDPVRTLTIDLQREYSITKVKGLRYASFTCLPSSVLVPCKSQVDTVLNHQKVNYRQLDGM